MLRTLVGGFARSLPVLCALAGTAAAERPVDLELVLAIDSSASVDFREFGLQVGGMVRSFRDPAIVEAIATGSYKAIAVSVIEWASDDLQVMSVPWVVIDSAAAAERIAAALERMPRAIETGATSISGALRFSASLFARNGYRGLRRVIDLSCDGRNNQGPPVQVVRDVLVGRDITINGLTILNEHPTLDHYFRQQIIGGPGAFVEIAADYQSYSDTFLRKLVREIRNVPISRAPVPVRPLPGLSLVARSWQSARPDVRFGLTQAWF